MALTMALEAAADGRSPSAVLRVANNSQTPLEALAVARSRGTVDRPFPYATVDVRGHIFDCLDDLPEVDQCFFVPGQVESCVTILRNILMKSAAGEVNGA